MVNRIFSIVGTSFQPGAGQTIGLLSPGRPVRLVRESDNPYDRNAVSIYASQRKLGHVPRGLAAEIAPLLDSGVRMSCTKTDMRWGVFTLTWGDNNGATTGR